MICQDAATVDYRYGVVDFYFNQGDSIILSFQFLDEDATKATGVDTPVTIAGYTVAVTIMTPFATLQGTISREDAQGIVCAEFDQKETDKLGDMSRHAYRVLFTDADGREFTPVHGHVHIGGDDCAC